MTTNQLAAGYYRKCVDRLAALAVLVQRQAFSDVVRESQEIVELAAQGHAPRRRSRSAEMARRGRPPDSVW